MAFQVVMPRLGWTMEVGQIVEWLKHDGDTVKAGDMLFSVETDKAVNEVEALDSGVLRLPPDAPQIGVDVPVGGVLAYLLQPGEAVPWETATAPNSASAPAVADTSVPANDTTLVSLAAVPEAAHTNGRAPAVEHVPAISPRARRIATELQVDWTTLTGSGRSRRIVERDVRAANVPRPAAAAPRATPLARRVAAEAGVDLHELAESMNGKRISRADVEAATTTQAPPPSAPSNGTPISGIRRIVAQRMAESAHTAAPVTLTTEVDATELVQLRAKIAADLPKDARAPSYTDFLVRIVALALAEHPALNATLANDAITQHADVHVGVAVDTERGLMVPVVRDAQHKSVGQIATESTRLIEQARQGRSSPDDLRGGTFTITNLGMYEIDSFTPIINLPECAILGVGRIVPRLQVIDEATEKVAVRKMLALSLTFDHRVVDGAPAARFLQLIKRFVEHPYTWITR